MDGIQIQGEQHYKEDILPPAEICEISNAGLFGQFDNYAGIATNDFGTFPISWMHLSKPTGHYVSRVGMHIVNFFLKHHAILLAGNSCAPGYFFPKVDPDNGWNQFQFIPNQDCGCMVLNIEGIPDSINHGVVFPAEPFMVLSLRNEWNVYENYLAAMQSKYRIRANKVFELSKNITSKQFSGLEMDDSLIAQCAQLLKETLRDKIIAMPSNLETVLKYYRAHFGPDFHFNVYYLNDHICGFISWVRLGKSMMAMQVGYNFLESKETQLYQRMMHDLIKIGIDNKLEKINLGRTATEIKSTLGAEPLANSFVIYAKSNLLFKCVAFYKKRFYKQTPFTLRSPFKG